MFRTLDGRVLLPTPNDSFGMNSSCRREASGAFVLKQQTEVVSCRQRTPTFGREAKGFNYKTAHTTKDHQAGKPTIPCQTMVP